MVKSYDSWIEANLSPEGCPREYLLALNDTLNVFTGKWKLQIIGALIIGRRRFSEIERSIPHITPRMLSKELKDLETNGVLRRITRDDTAFTVEYEFTESGKRLRNVFDAMIAWGLGLRKETMG